MTSAAKLNEFNHAEEPARVLLERLGWTYLPRETLAPERGDEREVLLKGRLRQTERVVFELEHIDATGMARNQKVHEYLTYGMTLTVDGPRGRDSRTVRFFDFDHPESGLDELVVTTQFRVRRGNERPSRPESDPWLGSPQEAPAHPKAQGRGLQRRLRARAERARRPLAAVRMTDTSTRTFFFTMCTGMVVKTCSSSSALSAR